MEVVSTKRLISSVGTLSKLGEESAKRLADGKRSNIVFLIFCLSGESGRLDKNSYLGDISCESPLSRSSIA